MSKKTPNKQDEIIGGNIRRIRLARGMSQEKLGVELALTFQQVQKYEKGTNGVRGSRMVQIANALNCSIADLFADTALPGKRLANASDDPVRRVGMTAVGVELCQSFAVLPIALQRAIVGVCEAAGDR